MFEQIFDDYRKAVESSFRMQQEMYRNWMNGLPVKPSDFDGGLERDEVRNRLLSYQSQWSQAVSDALEQHRAALNAQYRSGIETIESAFHTAEARTPEQYWRLTQEFWRKSIDSFKTAFEAQSKYVQGLAQMWLELLTRGKV